MTTVHASQLSRPVNYEITNRDSGEYTILLMLVLTIYPPKHAAKHSSVVALTFCKLFKDNFRH